jgi:hypothetical protein
MLAYKFSRNESLRKTASILVSLTIAATVYSGGGPQSKESKAEYRKGLLYGKVLDATGKPVSGATVALQQNGKVLAWTKTNEQGEYRLPADPRLASI